MYIYILYIVYIYIYIHIIRPGNNPPPPRLLFRCLPQKTTPFQGEAVTVSASLTCWSSQKGEQVRRIRQGIPHINRYIYIYIDEIILNHVWSPVLWAKSESLKGRFTHFCMVSIFFPTIHRLPGEGWSGGGLRLSPRDGRQDWPVETSGRSQWGLQLGWRVACVAWLSHLKGEAQHRKPVIWLEMRIWISLPSGYD